MINEVQQIAAWLVSKGFISEWIGPDGEIQPAPELQTRWLEEVTGADSNANNRIVFIKNVSSGTGDRFVSYPVVTFAVLGTTTESPVFAELLASELYTKLLEFECGSGIVHIEPLGRIGGPYRMESGRFVYDMEFRFITETGYILTGMK